MKAARVYAKHLRWAIVPLHDVSSGSCSCGDAECRSGGKHPRRSAWQHEATSDLDHVAAWAEKYPTANIGIATGEPSGFFVLDVDGDEGRASLAQLGEVPLTVTARTGSGGTHYLFKLPGFHVGNSVKKIADGIDIRGTGGQIVVQPSRSAKGAYVWTRSPFDHEIAEAPAWLVERLRPRVEHTAPAERQEFPPANDDVMEAARAALAAHGPAIEGGGGDDHTFRACAMLRHDFALTFDEAWPLAWEWNEQCAPPWSQEDLASKLRGGDRYGTGEYGAKRTADALQTSLAMIKEWREGDTGLLGATKLAQDIRAVVARGLDPVTVALITGELQTATGVAASKLALGKGTLATGDAPEGSIEVATDLHRVADEATKAISPVVFQRGGVVCEVIKNDDRTFIFEPKPARLIDLMSRSAKWIRRDEKGLVAIAPPPQIADIVHARRKHDGVRVLQAVTESPVFLEDGSILQERGYNAAARVFLEPNVEVVVPDLATRAQAVEAVDAFRDLLVDFKLVETADFSSWLATLLSPLVKAATKNAPAPLLCISASSPGAGKTLLADIMSRVVTGKAVEPRSYPRNDPAEVQKRITSFVLEGPAFGVFDNVNGRFGPDETLDRLLTASTWKDRLLGGNEVPALPQVTTWIATGNNVEPCGDTVRRVLMCRVDVTDERPQERTGFRHDPIENVASEYRAHYLSQALTILRAFHNAGRPDQKLPNWGSFSAWSALVRGALVWAGCADPFLTQKRAALVLNDTENEAHDFWISVVNDVPDGMPASIAALADQRGARGVLGLHEEITTYTLRSFLQRFIDRPRQGRRIRREVDPNKQQTRYFVAKV